MLKNCLSRKSIFLSSFMTPAFWKGRTRRRRRSKMRRKNSFSEEEWIFGSFFLVISLRFCSLIFLPSFPDPGRPWFFVFTFPFSLFLFLSFSSSPYESSCFCIGGLDSSSSSPSPLFAATLSLSPSLASSSDFDHWVSGDSDLSSLDQNDQFTTQMWRPV